MSQEQEDFSEHVSGDDPDGIADHAWVHTDTQCGFVTVETDSYEGVAMMNLATAEKLIPVLRRAVDYLKKKRRSVPGPPTEFDRPSDEIKDGGW